MDLQNRIAYVSVCSSVVKEIASYSLVQIQEIAISIFEVSDSQRSDRW